MNTRPTIQEELKDLNSQLPLEKGAELYSVPHGYFENFAASVLQKLKNENTFSPGEELENLSPLLAGMPKNMPFSLPKGYFNEATEGLVDWVKEEEPKVFGGSKELPYQVPSGYFETLPAAILKTVNPQEAKVIPITSSRKWMRYAVAVMVAGVIALSSVLYFGKDKSADTDSDWYSWVEKNLKTIPDKELEEFINTNYTLTPSIAKTETAQKAEVRKLLKDIPNTELDKFLEEVTVENEDVFLYN